MRDPLRDPMRDLSGDSMHESGTDLLPPWARETLAAPAESGAAARVAIMERVRRVPAPRAGHMLSAPSMRSTRWPRRGLLSPFGATAFAGVLGLLLCVRTIVSIGAFGTAGSDRLTTSVAVIGDTVVPSLQGGIDGTLRDTLRIVTFALRGANVQSASVIGDFNAWRTGATRLRRQADGSWSARVTVPRDVVRYDFVVNDEPLRGGAPVPSAAAESTRARLDTI